MPRYYFNVYNDAVTMDEDGAELANPHTARAYAVKAARSLAQDTVGHGYLALDHYIEVVDENQTLVDTVTFGDAVEIRRI